MFKLPLRFGKSALIPDGFHPMGQFCDDDVFVVGYPKSGNTWMQVLTSSLLYGFDPRRLPDSLVQELSPDVHYKKAYKRFRTPTVFKSHGLPCPEYKRVIYIVRDGRDVLCSYVKYLNNLGRNITMQEMVHSPSDLWPSSWDDHVRQWKENPFGAEMIFVRYEDLLTQRPLELKRIADFIGVEVDPEDCERIAAATDFTVMKKRVQKFGHDNKHWPKDKAFFRRGVARSYQDEMPADLQRSFVSYSRATLEDFQYEIC